MNLEARRCILVYKRNERNTPEDIKLELRRLLTIENDLEISSMLESEGARGNLGSFRFALNQIFLELSQDEDFSKIEFLRKALIGWKSNLMEVLWPDEYAKELAAIQAAKEIQRIESTKKEFSILLKQRSEKALSLLQQENDRSIYLPIFSQSYEMAHRTKDIQQLEWMKEFKRIPEYSEKMNGLDLIFTPDVSGLYFVGMHFSPPQYSESLYQADSENPRLYGAGDYYPSAFPPVEKEKDLPAVVGVYQCGDCVGILGWDSMTKSTFVYHMNAFDSKRVTYGLALLVIEMLKSHGTEYSSDVEILTKNIDKLRSKRNDYDNEIETLIATITRLDLLKNTRFTFVSKYTDNVDPLIDFLMKKIGLTQNQLFFDVPQDIDSSKGAQVVIDRNTGEICKKFSYARGTGITFNVLSNPSGVPDTSKRRPRV